MPDLLRGGDERLVLRLWAFCGVHSMRRPSGPVSDLSSPDQEGSEGLPKFMNPFSRFSYLCLFLLLPQSHSSIGSSDQSAMTLNRRKHCPFQRPVKRPDLHGTLHDQRDNFCPLFLFPLQNFHPHPRQIGSSHGAQGHYTRSTTFKRS